MPIFLTTESGDFLITEDGKFLILDKIAFAEVRRAYAAIPRTDEFAAIPRMDEFRLAGG